MSAYVSGGGEIWIGSEAESALIRLSGRATHLLGPPLKSHLAHLEQQGCARFVVDLSQCVCLDSTILGVLVSAVLRAQPQAFTLVNVAKRQKDLFNALGVSQLFSWETRDLPAQTIQALQPLEAPAPATGQERTTVKEAHEALLTANAANAPRFKDLLELLQEESRDGSG